MMIVYGLSALLTVFLWWFSTGLVLSLNYLPERRFPWGFAGATGGLVLALVGIVATRDATSLWSAYLAFASGLLCWAWLEVSYYMNIVTGTYKRPCPDATTGWRRFALAIQTSIYHELAVVGLTSLVVALTWNSANPIAAWTMLVLWLMRWSAKLNVYLGVPNLNEDWLPAHLDFLKSFIAKRPMNLLFPISVTAATVAAVIIFQQALEPTRPAFEAAGLTLVATLLILAILEHWLLVLPLPDGALWGWSKPRQPSNSTPEAQPGNEDRQPFAAPMPSGGFIHARINDSA